MAAQNLSQTLRAYCPTVYSAFGFKSRHINMTQRVSSHGRSTDAALEELQRRDLAKYWPVLSDIAAEFRRTKPRGLYSGVSGPAFEVLRDMHQGQLWTTNVIVVDEAGTLSVHINAFRAHSNSRGLLLLVLQRLAAHPPLPPGPHSLHRLRGLSHPDRRLSVLL